MLILEDLKGMSQEQILKHLTDEYGNGNGSELENKEVLIAYESVGSWGCDSSSFFLLRDKTTGELYEVHGSHCSCFGFEGQLELERSSVDSLKYRNREADVFYPGGYDNDEVNNRKAIREFINAM